MAVKRQSSFNSTSFLAKVGEGRSLGKYRKGQVVFSQGDAGDAVFYVQKGRVKVTVVSEQGKEAVVAILGTDGTPFKASWRKSNWDNWLKRRPKVPR